MAKKKKPHWTQTPEGKEKARQAQPNRYRNGNGGMENGLHNVDAPKGKTLAKTRLAEYARYGARKRLDDLMKEVTQIRAFLGEEK